MIERNTVEYLQPITGDFWAHCSSPLPKQWERFIKSIQCRGKGRIMLDVEIYSGELLAAKLQGEYVAFHLDTVS